MRRCYLLCFVQVTPLLAPKLPEDPGISPELGGIGHYATSILGFMKPPAEKSTAPGMGGPCHISALEAARQAADAALAAGRLPSPSRSLSELTKTQVTGPLPTPPRPSSLPRRTITRPALASLTEATTEGSTAPSKAEATSPRAEEEAHRKDAEEYYKDIPREDAHKEMRRRMSAAKYKQGAGKQEAEMKDHSPGVPTAELDSMRMEQELQELDPFHYRLGQLAYPDVNRRADYYALWYLAVSLNKARWQMLEVQAQRGVKSTGAGMKLLFWKEAVNDVLAKGRLVPGQFTDSHPVLSPFGRTVEKHPKITKAFVRGFTDARLKVIQQPGNVKQLFDHFDKFYGHFFNSLLEVTGTTDEHVEHMMIHVGRAIGLTTHCVMFWKKYARIGFTMLPADLCADNHVNLALLKNIPLASKDRAVQKLLYDVMCIAKTEMLYAQKLAPQVSPVAWPIVMECLYPNYYLGFLQRKNFDVSAMYADYNIENVGFLWYRTKKMYEWNRHQSMEKLVAEKAPLPLIGKVFGHKASAYKMTAGMGGAATVRK